MDISPPPSPVPAPPPPFPVLGVAAPLVVSVAVWAVTRSPYALLFAALGPVVAVAGVADQRISGRRSARRVERESRAALARLHAEVRARVAAARTALRSRAPSAREILDGSANPALLWRADPGDGGTLPIALGTGEVPSGLVWRGDPDARVPDAEERSGGGTLRARLSGRSPLRRIRRARVDARAAVASSAAHDPARWADLVRWVPDAPVFVPAAGGLGLRGAPALVEPVLRGVVVQLVHALPPDDLRIASRPAGPEWDWLERLPHAAEGLREARTGADRPAAPGVVPGAVPGEPGASAIRLVLGAREVVLAAAPRVESLPAACRTVLDVRTPGTARILAADTVPDAPDALLALDALPSTATAPSHVLPPVGGRVGIPSPRVTRTGLVRPDLVSLTEVERLADELADLARRRGLAAARAPLPSRVPFAELPVAGAPGTSTLGLAAGDGSDAGWDGVAPTRRPRTLAAVIGIGHAGPVAVDLVADGPHAVVAGTTGSGKSELLVTWMAALAAAHPPEEVTVLLVDFKGGAAFDPLLVLPHAVGLVTDLDGQGARRALESLRAEIRHRERVLREAGARDVDDPAAAGVLPRLVIVVDELAALLADQDGLHEVVADIAARGRSLGMHLVLCTQRPSGVVRDAVLANCDLRLSLRVNNEADSRALLGTAEAARLSDAPAGRCLVGAHGAPTRPFQVGVTTADDLARIAAARATSAPVRRPWLDPLPACVPLADLAAVPPLAKHGSASPGVGAPAVPFALVDLPAEQRRATAEWCPATDGHLLVIGGPGSGRSTCLRTIAASAAASGVDVVHVPADAEGCWDAVAAVVSRIRDPRRARDPLLVLADDLDVAVSRLDPEHQAALLEGMAAVVREGPHAGVALAVSGRRAGGPLQAVAAAAGPPVILALPSRQEHVLAGGDGRLFDARATPGAGEWRGERIQVAQPPEVEAEPEAESARRGRAASRPGVVDPAPRAVLAGGAVHALVTPSPVVQVARLREMGVDAVEATRIPPGWSPDQPFPGAAGDGAATRPEVGHGGHPDGGRAARPRVVVGDPDAWLLRAPLLADLRRIGDVVMEGCTPRDARTLLRVRAVPPPLAPVPGRAWRITPDGDVRRCSWPPVMPGLPVAPAQAEAAATAAATAPVQPAGVSR
ncbi:FtsK/SpoIIIE domain-containing protein [Clavibacter sepedonicus]|uniref:FtsK/SpoIIIE-related protein n=1 Tax=Clavibacter sepedonicus TaxID=31964 RepID=B0RFS0_CLASE|nr:FtsK/SpoIIIE domain-containing protein [Clavibacter sepedonicus]OQJ47896.1 cell division protein FtsK [Clavibacter sepedonicus]OQJ53451.1 cell division protein FtsK [Clavibacter sepedonicus]UUK64636.1 cell division protein FtsK [Clavibacter sepedonicus]CAQ02290.1 FtsK/SpoIIIE-related protein [Clavibacter sepedonicus]